MNLHITGHHVEVTPAMREYVSSKIDRITKHFDHVIDVRSNRQLADQHIVRHEAF